MDGIVILHSTENSLENRAKLKPFIEKFQQIKNPHKRILVTFYTEVFGKDFSLQKTQIANLLKQFGISEDRILMQVSVNHLIKDEIELKLWGTDKRVVNPPVDIEVGLKAQKQYPDDNYRQILKTAYNNLGQGCKDRLNERGKDLNMPGTILSRIEEVNFYNLTVPNSWNNKNLIKEMNGISYVDYYRKNQLLKESSFTFIPVSEAENTPGGSTAIIVQEYFFEEGITDLQINKIVTRPRSNHSKGVILLHELLHSFFRIDHDRLVEDVLGEKSIDHLIDTKKINSWIRDCQKGR